MKCLWCEIEFEPKRPWQKFCSDKCRWKYNRGDGSYHLPKMLDAELMALAEAQGVSNLEMLCKILHNTLNPGQEPLSDLIIYGEAKSRGK